MREKIAANSAQAFDELVSTMRTASTRARRFDRKQGRGLAILDTAPELPLSSDNQVLVERIGMGRDLHPFAAAGDHRKDRCAGRDDPHIVLQLRGVFLGGRFFGEVPGQHELGFEHRPARLHPPIEGCPHPAQTRVPDMLLDVGDNLAGVGLVPAAIEVFGDGPELDDEVADRSSGSTSPRFSCHSRIRAASSSPMMIRASGPPIK